MPFKLFSIHKKSKKDRSASLTTTELSNQKSEEHLNNDLKSDKSKHHFLSSVCKSSNHVHFKSTNTEKDKKVKFGSFFPFTKTKSLPHIPTATEIDAKISSTDRDDQPDSRHSNSKRIQRGSASYGTAMDRLASNKRLLDIAQLDNYMAYLRHTEDEGNLTNRLCCAQVLRMSLLRLEQRYQKSQKRILYKAATSNSQSPESGPRHQQMKDREVINDDHSSSHSDDTDEHQPSRVTCSSGQDSDSRESEQDSSSDHDSENNCQTVGSCKNSMLKVKSTPVWPRDIEIF